MLPRPHTVLFACAAFLSAAAGRAQCTTQWRAGEGVPGTDNWVATTHLWDPDGSGPANELLVVGGAFAIAGDRRVANLATYDLATGTFADLGGGCDGDVTHLAVLPTGELVVAGRFQHAGGVPAPGIARWDGTQWTAVGTVAVDVLAMTVDAGGDLVVAGLLPGFGYNPAVARWNASGWQLLGGPFTGNPNLPVSIRAIAALPNGDLAVGGCFSSAGSTPANRVARWNGSAWQALGNLGGTQVLGLKVAANGDLLACATIGYPNGGPSFVGRHHNGAWTQVGPVANDTIVDLVEMGNGDLVTTGRFTSFGATPAHYVARWDGTGWSQFGGVSPVAFGACLCVLPAGELIAAGWGGGNLARWNGQAWSALCDGIGSSLTASPRVNCVAAHRDVVAIAGTFTKIGSVEAFSIAMHRDGDWHPLGTGILGIPRALAILPNGDVVVGGSILEAGGQACSNLARWDGTAWRTFGSGANGWVNALAVLPDGDLVAAGVFSVIDGTPCSGVARWDGTHWWPLGSGFYDVTSLAVTETGTLLLGARFANPAAPSFVGVAQWTGSSWARQGVISMPGPPRVLAMPGGEIYATGIDFSPQPFLWRWNGSIWIPQPVGLQQTPPYVPWQLAALPGGDIVVAGGFTTIGGIAANGIARWNRTAWTPLGTGLTKPNGTATVDALASTPNGDLLVGGDFSFADDQVSVGLATLTTTCPASSASSGTACRGQAGYAELSALTLPWTGAVLRTRAVGLPAAALGVVVHGFGATNVPLPPLTPLSLPGCALLVNPQQLTLAFAARGRIETSISIPNDPGLAGVVLHQQILVGEIGPQGAISAITSSNPLRLTVGSF